MSDGRCIIKSPATIQGEQEFKECDDCSEYWILEDDIVPHDRTFRNAWEYDSENKKIVTNLEKAKQVHKEYINFAVRLHLKEKKIPDSNNEILKNLLSAESYDNIYDIIKHRDDFDLSNINSEEDLKKSWPAELTLFQYT